MQKISIYGAGRVGETSALMLAQKGLCQEVNLYDLNNTPYEGPAEIFAPFSLAVAGEWGSSGNNSCWKPPAESGYEGYLASECVWIQMWVELRDKAEREAYARFLDDYVMEQKQLFPKIRQRVRELLNGYVQSPAILDRIDDYIVPPGLGNKAGILGAIALAERQ